MKEGESMNKNILSKTLVLGVICLFMGLSIQPTIAVENRVSANLDKEENYDLNELDKSHSQRDSLEVWFAFITGEIKNAYHDNNSIYFQMVNVTIIGFFVVDLGNNEFGSYRLNESWFAKEVTYYGINLIRISFPYNLFEVKHVFGIVTGGYIENFP
jgi:hypothetical protein